MNETIPSTDEDDDDVTGRDRKGQLLSPEPDDEELAGHADEWLPL